MGSNLRFELRSVGGSSIGGTGLCSSDKGLLRWLVVFPGTLADYLDSTILVDWRFLLSYYSTDQP